jgi:hypothetical protein
MTPMRASIVGPLDFDDQEKGLDGILPFLDLLFGLRKLLNISGRVLEGDELPAARQRDRIIERAFPALR